MPGADATPFDIRLMAFKIPIRIHVSFWLMTGLMGLQYGNPGQLILWIVAVLLSILVHELGHALMAEAFGWASEIVLYWGGGVALSNRDSRRTAWKDMAISLAGPFAGFGLFVLTWLVVLMSGPRILLWPDPIRFLISALLYINLYWGLINLIPVLPLDGGHVCQSLCEILRLRRPRRTALQISILAAILAVGYFATMRQTFCAVMFAIFGQQAFLLLRYEDREW